jgi:hypothetical protein
MTAYQNGKWGPGIKNKRDNNTSHKAATTSMIETLNEEIKLR